MCVHTHTQPSTVVCNFSSSDSGKWQVEEALSRSQRQYGTYDSISLKERSRVQLTDTVLV